MTGTRVASDLGCSSVLGAPRRADAPLTRSSGAEMRPIAGEATRKRPFTAPDWC
jgi:hypothetical protein